MRKIRSQGTTVPNVKEAARPLRVELSAMAFRMIRLIMKRNGWDCKTDIIARDILGSALAHWDKQYMLSDRRYAYAEGVMLRGFLTEQTRQQMIKLVAQKAKP